MRTCARHLPTLTLLTALVLASTSRAADRTPFAASGGVGMARAASSAWAQDAVLVYLENDEDLDAEGAAPRWSYLFYSPSLDSLRVYSVEAGGVSVVDSPALEFRSPPLAAHWIDSGAAVAAAQLAEAGEFCRAEGGRLSTMLLMRRAVRREGDATSWTLVYTAPHARPLYVVVDAAAGKVRRTWRG